MTDIESSLPLAVVLEDEPLIAWDLGDILSEAGFAVEIFARVDLAADAISAGGVALAVLDRALGGGTTSEVAAAAASAAGVPIVFCSGSNLPHSLEGAAFVAKPYSREALLAAVATATEKVRAQGAAPLNSTMTRLDDGQNATNGSKSVHAGTDFSSPVSCPV